MDIKRAKQEIIDTIQAYLLKDAYGDYVIPQMHQRPVLLLGAPGIGKTRIMEQISRECNIALVAYTITHHTRQSAIGLPYILRETLAGRTFSMTQYTMSEIVASVYQKMDQTGLKEGILFIDEINCVSETLAPAMLQFLQYKTFGNHPVPRGWIIVAAGNPPEYNKSVRDFDVVTLDRVRKIEAEPDFDVWKEYAVSVNVHQAVLSYLSLKPRNFYRMETTVDGLFFATPRGWEDLSRILTVYEQMSKKADKEVIVQYIQHSEIAGDFANYLELYYKYQADYQIDEIFRGHIPDLLLKKTAHAPFDERVSLVGLLEARCTQAFREYGAMEDYTVFLHKWLLKVKHALAGAADKALSSESGMTAGGSSAREICEQVLARMRTEREQKQKAELLTRDGKITRLKAEAFLEESLPLLPSDGGQAFEIIRSRFATERSAYEQTREAAGETLERAFDFMEAAFGSGQEMVLFVTDLNANPLSLRYMKAFPCERYDYYNRELLIEDRSQALLREIDTLV